jgi:hypothetical protein
VSLTGVDPLLPVLNRIGRSGAGFDVLIASDAVGMGLNLNIRRIIFSSLEKFNGERMTRVGIEDVGAPTPILTHARARAHTHTHTHTHARPRGS